MKYWIKIFFCFFLTSNCFSEEILLICGDQNRPSYTYIDLDNKKAGPAYLQKNKKDLYIYDWAYEDVKISDKEIEYLNTVSFWAGYMPKIKNYSKIVIDRYTGTTSFYNKSPDKVFSFYIPDFLKKLIDSYSYAYLFQFWKKDPVVSYCENENLSKYNYLFKTFKDYEMELRTTNIQKKF